MVYNGGAGIFDKFPKFVAAVREANRLTQDEPKALVASMYDAIAADERAEEIQRMWNESAMELVYKDTSDLTRGFTKLYGNHQDRWREMARRLRTGLEEDRET